MKTVLVISSTLCLIFMNCSHPIALMTIILSQTMLMCLLIWMTNSLSWFSFILFLIFLGGLMVLFIYISSLASNEKFALDFMTSMKILTLTSFTLLVVSWTWNSEFVNKIFIQDNFTLNSMYSNMMFYMTISTMVYLLLTLIVVVKMTSKFEGPLRNMVFKSIN